MTKPLTIVARFKAKPGREEKLARNLLNLIPPTLVEPGCLNYDLHRSTEDPAVFLFFENWESRETWLDHMESEHLKAHQRVSDELVAKFEILEMTRLDHLEG